MGAMAAGWVGTPVLALLGWFGGILYLSSLGPTSVSNAAPAKAVDSVGLPIDIVGHLVLYAVLGALAIWAMGRLRPAWGWSMRGVTGAVVLGVMCGLFDEWYQGFIPGRDSSFEDVGLDTIGALAGGLSALGLYRLLQRLHQRQGARVQIKPHGELP